MCSQTPVCQNHAQEHNTCAQPERHDGKWITHGERNVAPHPWHHRGDCLFVMRGDTTDWHSKPTQNPINWNCVVTSLIKQRLSAWCVHCHSLMGPLVQGNVVSLRISACMYVLYVSYVCISRACDCENQRIMSDIESELLHDSSPTTAPQTVAIIISSQVLPSSDLTWKRNSFFL